MHPLALHNTVRQKQMACHDQNSLWYITLFYKGLH